MQTFFFYFAEIYLLVVCLMATLAKNDLGWAIGLLGGCFAQMYIVTTYFPSSMTAAGLTSLVASIPVAIAVGYTLKDRRPKIQP